MSSRIEKGGSRFKPSIVPRRSAGGTAPGGSVPSSSPATAQSPSQNPLSQQQQAAGTAAAPAPSPSLPSHPPRPPSARSKGSATPIQIVAERSAIVQPITTPNRPQSYAFSGSPSVIPKPGTSATTRSHITPGQSSADTAKPKPAFRRPSVSKPRPGSRASVTPAPQAVSTAQLSATTSAIESSHDGDNGLSEPSSRSDAPPNIGSSSSARNANASSIRAGAGRTAAAAPVPVSVAQIENIVEKASQPDPFQLPQRSTRSKTASTSLKQSASQQDALSNRRQSTGIPLASNGAHTSAVSAADQLEPLISAKKGKGRENVDPSDATGIRSSSHIAKPRSQSTEVGPLDTEQDKAARAARRRLDATNRLQKRRLKRKELSSGKPRRPLSAYLLFVNSVRAERQAQKPDMSLTELTSQIAAEWREFSPDQRTKWEAEASLLRQQYDDALGAWKIAFPEGVSLGPEDESDMETTSELGEDGEPIRRKKRRHTSQHKPHTVSDDEEEYRKQIYQQGEQLAASRIDPSNVTMADISAADYKTGRAGPRTFEAERVYKRLVSDRRAAARSAVLGEHVLGEKLANGSPSPAPAARILRTTNGVPVQADVEEVVDEEVVDQTGDEDGNTSDIDDSAPETDADGATDGEGGVSSSNRRARSRRETSVAATDVSFRENRFAIQTRIVDGKIVLDETSLFANYGNGEDDRDNMEVVDEREGDRFVNAATYSRKLGRNRKWNADETAKFYRSLQQWGTDFEMIARLFPGRDRVMIKKKFNVEERSNPKLVDHALKNSLPVNLEAYAQAIGIDLSGPPPEIKADLRDIESLAAVNSNTGDAGGVEKREGTAPITGRKGERSDVERDDDGDDGYEYEEVVEIDDQGNEQVVRRRLGKKAGGKAGKKRRTSARKNSMSTPAPPTRAASTSGAAADAEGTNVAAVDVDAAAEDARPSGPPSIGTRRSSRRQRG